MAFAGSVLQEVLNAGRNPFRRRVTVAQGKHQLCTPKTNRKGPAPGLPPPPPPPPGRSRGSILRILWRFLRAAFVVAQVAP